MMIVMLVLVSNVTMSYNRVFMVSLDWFSSLVEYRAALLGLGFLDQATHVICLTVITCHYLCCYSYS